MLKLKGLLGFLLVSSLLSNGQTNNFCFTSEAMKKWMELHPNEAQEFQKQQLDLELKDKADYVNNYSDFKLSASSVYTIPVVWHILHLNGQENISDAQINDAMYILNRDFRKQNWDTTTIITEFKNIAADANIEFMLASKDENGNCTNGIVRHYDSRTNWVFDFSNYVYTWNPTKYLNIYVVTSINNGAAGYTFLPGSVSWAADAIVIRHDYVGSMGTSNLYVSRALTHEVGHWFNLQHVWGTTNNPGVSCGDDGVGDTPITKGFNFCNTTNPAICNPPIKENVQNYMEYSYCTRMFTLGQANRMSNTLQSPVSGRSNLHTTSNLIATGVINPISPCPPIADFTSNKNEVCVNTNISLTDLSYNGAVTGWDWYFPDGNNLTSTLQNPITSFSVSGIKAISLKASNTLGSDSVVKSIVTVLAGAGSGINNIAQGFESITFPNSVWIANTPKIGAGWIQKNTVGAVGSKCIMIDNYFDSPSENAVFYSPMYDISSLPNPVLTFYDAYSQNTSGSNDRLKVFYSVDCANSWQVLFSKSGTNLHTLGAGIFASGAFNNPSPNQWRKENVSLAAIASANNLLLKFEFTHDSINPGNNLFLDEINLESASGISKLERNSQGFKIAPNPNEGAFEIRFDSESTFKFKIEIMDVCGKVISRLNQLEAKIGDNSIKYEADFLDKGIYFIRFLSENQDFTAKLVIQ